ncbi:MAG: hypothetical protein U0228_15800 [Myxococcaceae bacterium]
MFALSLLVLAIELPQVSSAAGLDVPKDARAHVTVTETGITFSGRGSKKQVPVTTLQAWKPGAKDGEGPELTTLGAAFDAAKREREDDRFFSSEIDGWAELSIDRRAPMALVTRVLSTVGSRAGSLGLVVATPEGERVVRYFFPLSDAAPSDDFIVGVEATQVQLVRPGAPAKPSPRTADAVRAAVASFVKKGAKGRRALMPTPMGTNCLSAKLENLPPDQCWHPRVIVVASPEANLTWGDLLPLAAAAHESVPDVIFGSL